MSDNHLTSDTAYSQHFPWHDRIWQQITNSRIQDHLHHAILLSGEEGLGKYHLALRLAKSLICINSSNNSEEACNQCPACTTFEARSNPDFLTVDLLTEKKQIGVDQIRQVSEFLNYSRSYNTIKVVVINLADRMNINASNSLLKSLEEPSEETVIILLTSQVNKLLTTIKSRCHLISMASPTRAQALVWLDTQQISSDICLSKQELLNYVDNKPLLALTVDPQELADKDTFMVDLHNLIHDECSITVTAKKWEKYDVNLLVNWQLKTIQQQIKKAYIGEPNSQLNSNKDQNLSISFSEEQLWKIYKQLLGLKQYIHTSVNPLMFIENMLMLWKNNSLEM